MTSAHPRVRVIDLLAEIRRFRRAPEPRTLFDGYAFADYRGDRADAGGVVLAVALGGSRVRLVRGISNRRTLSAAFLDILRATHAAGIRVLFGQDHQYGIPLALAQELGLRGAWRSMMRELFVTGPLAKEAVAGNAGAFAANVNAWLVAHGRPSYFHSHTNGARYGIPTSSPRPKGEPTERRLTETKGFPLCRIGDNGTVGGQSIVGIPRLLDLLDTCALDGIAIKVWPFDGLDVGALGSAVALEPYPSHVREKGVVQTDENDAVASTLWAQRSDREGRLAAELDLSTLTDEEKARVRLEGWMAGIRPERVPVGPREEPTLR